jgi:hypothetical protein
MHVIQNHSYSMPHVIYDGRYRAFNEYQNVKFRVEKPKSKIEKIEMAKM